VVISLLVGVFSWYVSWVTILTFMYEVNFLWLVIRPVDVFEAMFYYMDDIQWTFNDSQVSPFMAKISYLFEFLAFLLPTILVAVKKLYYCEFCEQFMKPKDYFIVEKDIVDEHLDRIREGDLSFLDQVQMLRKMDTVVDEQYKINLHRCEGCGERVFNFRHLKMKHKKGKTEVEKTRDIVENIYACRPVTE